MSASGGILVLGVGNLLLGDEGLGVWAVARLARRDWGEGVRFLDGGTLGLALLGVVAGVERLLVLDAVRDHGVPGGLIRLDGAAGRGLLPHALGVGGLLDALAATGEAPREVVILGLEPARLDWGMTLSPAVEAGLEAMEEAALAVLRGWGVAPRPGSYRSRAMA